MIHAHSLSVVLPKAKTSAGNPQVLQVDDQTLVDMAIATVRKRSRSALLWTGSQSAFRETFQSLLEGLGFPAGSYLPYSLSVVEEPHGFTKPPCPLTQR